MDKSIFDLAAQIGVLAMSAAGAGTMAVPGSQPAGGGVAPNLLDLYAEQTARPDGKAVFWLTRGREYLVQGAQITPVYDRYVISASRIIRLADGGFKRPYTETAYATMPGVTEVPERLQSPVTGASYPNPIIRPVRLTLTISPSGEITQDIKLETPKITSTYRGAVSLVHGPAGKPLVACAFNAHVIMPTGILDLTELGPYHADGPATADGFTPASRDIVVVRAAPAYLGAGESATMAGIHASKKYATLPELVEVLTPIEKDRYAVWLGDWERLLFAEEDVVIE
jgi:hypothetical protein